MRIFYFINEPFEGYQTGYRKALINLKKENIISDIEFFSFAAEEKKYGSWERTLSIVKEKVINFHPDVVLVAHISKHHKISKEFVKAVNDNNGKETLWVYDERDAYGFFSKPLPRNVLKFASICDLVVLSTYGTMMKRFYKNGAKNILYLPDSFDYNFGTEWEPSFTREYDVIMIANNIHSRIPFRTMPGAKEREKIVTRFAKEFGDRFAVFGRGWGKVSTNKGPINFFDQERVLRKSWLSIGMDHYYNYPGYYSDRLPIAIVSGVPHLTYKTPGLEKLFVDKQHVLYYRTPEEALELAKECLQWGKQKNIEFGEKARKYVMANFSEDEKYKKMFSYIKENIQTRN